MFPEDHARLTPDAPAVIDADEDVRITFQEFSDRIYRLLDLLRARGLRDGDVVAVMMDNCADYLVTTWAAFRGTMNYTAIGSDLRSSEVAYIIEDCGARAIVTDEAHAHVLEEALASSAHSVELRLISGSTRPGWINLDEALQGRPPEVPPNVGEGSDFLYSSGSTGRPKGIRMEPGKSAVSTLYFPGFPAGVLLSTAPLHFSGPLRMCMVSQRSGGAVVLLRKFEPRSFLRAVERYRVTSAQMVPIMFTRLLKLSPEERASYDVSSLQIVSHAGAPCPVDVKRQMLDWFGPVIYEGYSGSEFVGDLIIGPQEWLEHPGSVGKAANAHIKVVRADGSVAAPYEVGAVYFTEPRSFNYHNDAAKTASAHNEHGWATLGDIGYVDDDGYLYLTGRAAFTIVSGGANIYPQEIEDLLIAHPSVADVAVFGVPNDEWGEEVKAVIQLEPEASPATDSDADALRAGLVTFCREHMAGYKCPRSIDFVDQLPRTTSGKMLKAKLRDQYLAGVRV